MTQTGPTAEIKARIDAFLAGHRYRVAPFTIEDADYAFALIYDDAIARNDRATADRTAEAYLARHAGRLHRQVRPVVAAPVARRTRSSSPPARRTRSAAVDHRYLQSAAVGSDRTRT